MHIKKHLGFNGLRKTHLKLNIIITGDGLFSKQPFIDELKKTRMSFILVAKRTDRKILFQWVQELLAIDAGGKLDHFKAFTENHCFLIE